MKLECLFRTGLNKTTLTTWQINDTGMPTAALARSLNKRGIKGKRGGKWQGNSITRTINNDFHTKRLKFQHPTWWGSKSWHRK